MRRFSLSVLLVAICLLPVGIGSGASAHSHTVAALDGALANTARAQAQMLEDYFSRARSIDLLTANNDSIGEACFIDRAPRSPAWSGAPGPPSRICPRTSRPPPSSAPTFALRHGRSTRHDPMSRPTPRNESSPTPP
jgi:hypothetical protein